MELAGDGPGEEGLAGTGRAVEQEAVPADVVLLRLLGMGQQEADGVAQFGLDVVHAADVGEVGEVPRDRRQLGRRPRRRLAGCRRRAHQGRNGRSGASPREPEPQEEPGDQRKDNRRKVHGM